MTGAKTFIGEPDKDYVNGALPLSWAAELKLDLEAFEADVLVKDGDTISLGNTILTAIASPGHTPGAMSYIFEVQEGERKLIAGIHGGAGINSLRKIFLTRYNLPFTYRDDYFATMDKLKTIPVDVYLGNHVGQNQTPKKYQQLIAGNKDAFVDPTGWAKFADSCKKKLAEMIEKENAE